MKKYSLYLISGDSIKKSNKSQSLLDMAKHDYT